MLRVRVPVVERSRDDNCMVRSTTGICAHDTAFKFITHSKDITLVVSALCDALVTTSDINTSPYANMCCYDNHASPGFPCERMWAAEHRGRGQKLEIPGR